MAIFHKNVSEPVPVEARDVTDADFLDPHLFFKHIPTSDRRDVVSFMLVYWLFSINASEVSKIVFIHDHLFSGML